MIGKKRCGNPFSFDDACELYKRIRLSSCVTLFDPFSHGHNVRNRYRDELNKTTELYTPRQTREPERKAVPYMLLRDIHSYPVKAFATGLSMHWTCGLVVQ
jgi:hypothetical protein